MNPSNHHARSTFLMRTGVVKLRMERFVVVGESGRLDGIEIAGGLSLSWRYLSVVLQKGKPILLTPLEYHNTEDRHQL